MAAEALAERIRVNERFELRHEIVVVAERELEVDTSLDARKPELVEAIDLVPREVVVREVVRRGTAPERERLAQLRGCRGTLERPGFGEELLESVRVEVFRRDLQPVTGSDRLHGFRPELLAQARYVSLQRLGRGLGRLAVPQLVDEPVAGHRLAGVQQHDREQLSLLPAAQLDRGVAFADLERPENQIPQ